MLLYRNNQFPRGWGGGDLLERLKVEEIFISWRFWFRFLYFCQTLCMLYEHYTLWNVKLIKYSSRVIYKYMHQNEHYRNL